MIVILSIWEHIPIVQHYSNAQIKIKFIPSLLTYGTKSQCFRVIFLGGVTCKVFHILLLLVYNVESFNFRLGSKEVGALFFRMLRRRLAIQEVMAWKVIWNLYLYCWMTFYIYYLSNINNYQLYQKQTLMYKVYSY